MLQGALNLVEAADISATTESEKLWRAQATHLTSLGYAESVASKEVHVRCEQLSRCHTAVSDRVRIECAPVTESDQGSEDVAFVACFASHVRRIGFALL